MNTQATPYSILREHYLTSTPQRLTSNEEFNRDAEYMIEVKEMMMKAMKRNRKFYAMVREWAFEQKEKLQIKTWGK